MEAAPKRAIAYATAAVMAFAFMIPAAPLVIAGGASLGCGAGYFLLGFSIGTLDPFTAGISSFIIGTQC